MLKKHAKPAYRSYIRGGAKIAFVVEAVLFAASYGVWYRMNTSRDFRLYMHNNNKWALDGFYKIGELFSSSNLRDNDMNIWIQEGKISQDA